MSRNYLRERCKCLWNVDSHYMFLNAPEIGNNWNCPTINLYTWYTTDLKTPVNLRTPQKMLCSLRAFVNLRFAVNLWLPASKLTADFQLILYQKFTKSPIGWLAYRTFFYFYIDSFMKHDTFERRNIILEGQGVERIWTDVHILPRAHMLSGM